MNLYKGPQDVLSDINKLKDTFAKETEDCSLKSKDLLLSQECEKLVFKSLEHLLITASMTSNSEKRNSQERINYLEQQLNLKKQDMLQQELSQANKMEEIQT